MMMPDRRPPQYVRLLALALAAAGCAVTTGAAAGDTNNLFVNAGFREARPDGTPAGWTRRTTTTGYVRTRTDEAPAFVEIGVRQSGEDSFIQQAAQLPADTVRVTLAARYRWADIVPGAKGYQHGAVQGRFTRAGSETGSWIDLAALTGTCSNWVDKSRTVDVPAGADGLFLRLALYGVQTGRLDVAQASCVALSSNAVVAQAAEQAARAAIERKRYRPAAPFGDPPGSNRLARLHRGVNINNWFGQPYNASIDGTKGGFSPEWFGRFITDAELAELARLGCGHVRLPVDPQPFMDLRTGALDARLLPALRDALRRIQAHGMAVIVDAHPKMPQLKNFRSDPERSAHYLAWWAAFAAALADTDPDWVFLEPMNEPGGQGFYGQTWSDYQDRLFVMIRSNAPRHTLIGNAGGYQVVRDLDGYVPHPDRNIIYAVHYYDPSQFTHQGAPWMKDWYHPLRHIPWPFGAAELDAMIAGLDRTGANRDKAAAAEKAMRGGVQEGVGTPEHIAAGFDRVAAWSRTHARAVVIGEFGAECRYAAVEHRAAWSRTVRTAAEARGIGWSWWDYAGSMPLMDGANAPGRRKLIPALAEALGLHSRPADATPQPVRP